MNRIALTAAGAVLLAGCTTTDGASPGQTGTPPARQPTSASGGVPTLAGADPDGSQCRARSVEASIGPGEAVGHSHFTTMIIVTKVGSGACTLHGSSQLKIFTGGTGAELPIKQVERNDGTPYPELTLKPGDIALMTVEFSAEPVAGSGECLEGGAFARVTLPGDTEEVEAWPENREDGIPQVCGAVVVTPWFQPG